MDGVLTDSEPIICQSAIAMFAELGVTAQPEDFLPFVGAGEDKYVGGVAAQYGVDTPVAELKQRTYELYLEIVPGHLQAFPGVHDLIKSLRANGYRVAVASSADRVKVEANLHEIGIPAASFDAVISAEDAEHKKPAPDIFLAAIAALGVDAGEAVVIEDAVNGVLAAKAAGIACIGVCQSFPADRLASADLILPGVIDITLDHIKALLA